MRADARRNRLRILDAARAEITAHGTDVAMEQIATSAGVAVGTLYRHYPTKADLVDAILAEVSEAALRRVEEAAREATRPHDAIALIERMLADLLEEAALNHAVKAAASVLGGAPTEPEQERRGRDALETLITAAQADGDLGTSVTTADIYLVIATAPTGLPASARTRWLELMLAGLRAVSPADGGPP